MRDYTESETAKRLEVSVRVLRDWRLRGTGPPYRDLDGEALYDFGEVVEWLDSRASRGAPAEEDRPARRLPVRLEGLLARPEGLP